jgi:hypothetical protein
MILERCNLPRNADPATSLVPTAVTHKSLAGLYAEMVFGTSRVSANLRLKIGDPFCRCNVQVQNSAATSIVKIP